MPPLNYSAATDKGLSRANNEDSYLSSPEAGLWVVADGMGGHEAGEVASAIVRETLQKAKPQQEDLSQAIQNSHHAVLNAVENGVGAPGMGSTVVALKSTNHDYEVAWVGDSRAYLWTHEESGGLLEQLTTDHSYVQMLLASGAIGEDEVDNHPDKNVITQCIGSQELSDVRVDSVKGEWEKEQWILICSDGLTDEVDDKAIAQTLCNAKNTREAVNQLMQKALDNGGHDNITLQIVESPYTQRHPLSFLWEWVPNITGTRTLDGTLYGAAIISLLLLLYWIVN